MDTRVVMHLNARVFAWSGPLGRTGVGPAGWLLHGRRDARRGDVRLRLRGRLPGALPRMGGLPACSAQSASN